MQEQLFKKVELNLSDIYYNGINPKVFDLIKEGQQVAPQWAKFAYDELHEQYAGFLRDGTKLHQKLILRLKHELELIAKEYARRGQV